MSTAWKSFCSAFRNKKVLVFGLGVLGGGEGVVRTLVEAGAVVRITDLKTEQELHTTVERLSNYSFEQTLGKHTLDDIEWADCIVKNPSVPFVNEYMLYARKLNKAVTNDVAMYLEFTKTRTIGVTGTRGKTTTSSLLYAAFHDWNSHTTLMGNIPGSCCIQHLRHETEDGWSILELSSFQLEGCHDAKKSPQTAVITNLYPDHLNRYLTMDTYAQAKSAILAYQTSADFAVLSKHSDWTAYFQKSVRGNYILSSAQDLPEDFTLKIPGEHNRENAAMVFNVAAFHHCPLSSVKRALETFEGVPFRLQKVHESNGITYINDTTSTTPKALEIALKTVHTPFILIAGGTSKMLPLDALRELLLSKPKHIVLLQGTGTDELVKAIPELQSFPTFPSLREAVQQAKAKAAPGDTIMLSPGFSSFGMFINEFDRGEQFNQLVVEE